MTDYYVLMDDNWTVLRKIAARMGVEFMLPQKGVVYTIRERATRTDAEISVLLYEVKNERYSFADGLLEPYFALARFRRLRPLDYSSFIALCSSEPNTNPVPAKTLLDQQRRLLAKQTRAKK